MNAKQIKEILRLIRPALVSMYGNQKYRLLAYSQFYTDISFSGKFQIWGESKKENYKVQLCKNEVVALGKGEIEV